MTPTEWTDDEKRTAMCMFKGGIQTKEIGVALGRTKNAVCGQIKRLRDRERSTPIATSNQGRPVTEPVKLPDNVSTFLRPSALKADPEKRARAMALDTRVHILDARDGQCRYIGKSILHVCGRQTAGGSWCADHMHVVYEGRKANVGLGTGAAGAAGTGARAAGS